MDLSTAMETEIHLPFLTADESGPKHLQTVLSRAAFEFLVEDLLRMTIDECAKALAESKLEPTDIDEVIMVGGSSRIPKAQEMVKQLFVGCPLNKSFNPDEVVAVGAAVQAGMLSGSGPVGAIPSGMRRGATEINATDHTRRQFPETDPVWHYGYLFAPALTLGGGTWAIQRNIVAEMALGLPREPDVQHGMSWAETQKARP